MSSSTLCWGGEITQRIFHIFLLLFKLFFSRFITCKNREISLLEIDGVVRFFSVTRHELCWKKRGGLIEGFWGLVGE
jgi:hypothetical protein